MVVTAQLELSLRRAEARSAALTSPRAPASFSGIRSPGKTRFNVGTPEDQFSSVCVLEMFFLYIYFLTFSYHVPFKSDAGKVGVEGSLPFFSFSSPKSRHPKPGQFTGRLTVKSRLLSNSCFVLFLNFPE